MSIEVEYNYNPDEHYAPPIRIQWMARNAKRLTQMRWIFIHCCGQIGTVNGRNISSRFPCKGRMIWNVTRRHHASQLQLLRTNHSHIIKYTPPLARWRCCHREIAAWDDAWSSRDRKIPFQYVDSGCLEGMYDCEAEPESDPDPCNFPTALVAIPLHRKPKTTATKKRSHSSSGLQTVVIEKNKLLDPHMINFTQNSVLKLFSDKNRPSIVETAVLIFKGNMKIEDIPTIRVASRSNSEADDFYTADNRRLFLHKILGTKELRVDWIQWTTEFDGKLNQNIRFDPQTRFLASNDAIIECRNDCYKSLLIKEGKTMDPGKIKFTKSSISTRFNDKKLPSLLDSALMILRGKMTIEDILTIRVATRGGSENDIFYTLDNRRLFLLKLLKIKEVKVDWVEWTTDFDEKLNQNITCTRSDLRFSVGEDGIADCRNDCFERLLIKEGKTMDPRKIKFTRSSISTHFDDKELPSLLDTALMILRGKITIEEIPTILVATRSNIESGIFYTLDNRRLLLFKILNLKKVKVDWVEWTTEFDGKLNQNIEHARPHIQFSISKDTIIDYRNDCYKSLLIDEGKTMDPGKIEFTKSSISTRFNDKELPTLLDTALMILRGEMMIGEIPTIRVATRGGSENDIFYTLDNRRLFLLKLLNIKKVKVDWVEWTTEFDEKLNQNITCTLPDLRFSVGKDDIADCRNYCYESLIIEKGKTMDPRSIEFTKSSILKYFNDFELPSLLDTALMILRGKMMIGEIPTIRVATRGGSGNYVFYTLDNRRLFLFKLLNIKKVKVDWVEWTTGFDEKLNKDIRYDLFYHFRTYKDDIKKCRNNCYDSLLIERGKTMDPAKIQFTKSSVLKHLNDKELPSLLETALMILRGKMTIEEIPTIRVATRGGSEKDVFYTLDNRRLFLFKILNIKKLKVDWVEWTTGFDEKLNKDIKYDLSYHFRTYKDDIKKCRNNCYDSLLIKRGKTMNPAKIQFTKSSVLKHFNDKELPSLLDTALMILRGKIKIEEIPPIRVATRGGSENYIFYTLDNRRLFLFKVLKIKKVKVDWVEWTTDFDGKLNKDIKYDQSYRFITHKDAIMKYRNNCYGCLFIERGKTMDPGKIKFTKSSVQKHFDNKELPSLLETALMILRGKIKIEEIPPIRVATRSNLENDDFYTANNRRLFLFKVLKIKEVKVDWVEWNLEIEQHFKNDSRFDSNLHFDLTDAIDILDCRKECVYEVCFKEKSERVFHVPSECVGYIVGNEGDTIRLFRKIFGANIKITPSSSSLLLYSVSISKRMGSPNSFKPSAAKKRILKMVKKKYNSFNKKIKNEKGKGIFIE